MTVNTRRGVVRNANRVVSRLRMRVSTALVRGQLGPGTESAVELADNSMWSHHRPL
jgi:hypothetical protein